MFDPLANSDPLSSLHRPPYPFHIFNLIHLIFTHFFIWRLSYCIWSHTRAAIGYHGYVRPCMPHPSNTEMMDPMDVWMDVCGTHRAGGVTRPIFKVACAQTETQGEGGARGRPLGNATGSPSIHSSNASCQRWREVRGKTRRPLGHSCHHDHSHRRLVCKTRRQVQTRRRARPGGRAAAKNATGSDRGGERHTTHKVSAATCPVRTTFFFFAFTICHRGLAAEVMFFLFFQNVFAVQESRALSSTLDPFEPRVC